MKKNVLISIFALLMFFSVESLAQSPYTDKVTFDYDIDQWCDVCADDIIYTSAINDSFTDNTSSAYYLKNLTIRLKYMACSSQGIDLGLNGFSKSAGNSYYGCSCGTHCDSLEVVFTEAELSWLYRYKGKNTINFNGNSNNLYIDRIEVIREFGVRGTDDAGAIWLAGLNEPRICAGTQSLNLIVANFGVNQINSLDIDWEWNGSAQSTVSSSALIDTIGSSSGNYDTIGLGTKTIASGQLYTLKAWTVDPNGNSDTINTNDTLYLKIRGAYSGNYTIGGTSPDFATIQSAYDSLSIYGVCGAVTLRVRDGVYNEQINIKSIPGASITNTITLESQSADSTKVTVNYSSGSGNNFVVRITNAGYLRFQNITFESLNASYGRVFDLQQKITNIQVNNSRILGPSVSTTSTNMSLVMRSINNSNTDSSLNIRFNNNYFYQGSTGLYFNNSGSYGRTYGLKIENNRLENQYYRGIYIYNGTNVFVENNRIESNTGTTTSYNGIYLEGTRDSIRITYNRIFCRNGGTGIYFYYHYSEGIKSWVAGNEISTYRGSSSSSAYGIYFYDCDHVNVVYNSIRRQNPNTGGFAVYFNYCSNHTLYNNAIENSGGGKGFYVSGYNPGEFGTANNNLYFNNGSDLGDWDGFVIQSIDDLRTKIKSDSNSYSSNPNFSSTYDLHPYNVDMDGNARVYSAFNTDLDGKTRNSSTPDIGAYEFNLLGLDAAPVEIKPFIAGNSCVQAVIRNMGATTLTSLSIDWEVNGTAKTAVNWTGSLPKGDTAIVCLDTITFKRDTAYQFKIWTYAPNSGTDSFTSNDTITSTLYPAMRGVYTIGGTSPDFSSFASAINALALNGVLDSVWMRVRSGTYTEVLNIPYIKGARQKASVIFESESKDSSSVILRSNSVSSSTYGLIALNNASGISFRRMSFSNESSYYRTIFYAQGNTGNFELSNCHLRNFDSTSTNYYSSLFIGFPNSNEGYDFRNNLFERGSYGIYLYVGNSGYLSDVNIVNNQLLGQTYTGIYVDDLRNLSISQNILTSSTASNVYSQGIYLGNTRGTYLVNNNKVTVSGNNLWTVFYSYYHLGDTARIFNNMFSGTSEGDLYAVYLDNLTPVQFHYNNVLCKGKDSLESTAMYVYYGESNIRNNNLVNELNGYALYVNWIGSGSFRSNYNNLFTNGMRTVYWQGTNYSSLSAYTSSIGHDTNSVSVTPLYQSSSDLHVNSVALNGKATPIAGVTTDFDGETRNTTTPDIGADEFNPPARDAGVVDFISPAATFEADTTEIIVAISNFGLDTLTSVTAFVQFNADTLPRNQISRTIAPGDSIHVYMGTYVFRSDTSYTFIAYTSSPNGNADQRNSNDTLRSLNREAVMSGVYTIGGSMPDFTGFKEAISALERRGMKDSVRFRVRSGTYNERIEMRNVAGGGALNSIVFESEVLNADSVTIQFTPSFSDTNYVLLLDGIDGITFRYLGFNASGGSSYGTAVALRSGVERVIFDHNRFIGANVNTSSTNFALFYMYNSISKDLQITNNYFYDGSYAMYMYGYLGWPEYRRSHARIENNLIENQFYALAYLEDFDSITFNSNTYNSHRYDYNEALRFYDIVQFKCNANRLNMRGDIGMYLQFSGTSSSKSELNNNAIYVYNTNNATIYGIYTYYCNYTQIANNTVRTENNSTSTSAYRNYYGDNNWLYNNIFNASNGYAFYHSGTTLASSFTDINYNNYYRNTGSSIWYRDGTVYNDLSSWISGNAVDSMSFTQDPAFLSNDTLRATELDLYKSGKSLSEVKTDILGKQRDTSAPDLGAYNMLLPLVDAGIERVLTPQMPFPADTQQVQIVIRNYGSDTLKSVNVAWSLNGNSKTPVSWSGALITGDTAWITLGTHVFSRDTAYDFTAYTYAPNSSTDNNSSNDTVNLQDQYPAMSGIYTIGGATPDFASFNDAITAMNRGGIIDSVRFDVRSGTYNEQVRLKYVLGANRPDAIIFQSANRDSSQVVLIATPSSSANYTIQLDSARGVTFRYMTIKTSGTTYSRLIHFTRYNEDISFLNNRLEGDPGTTSSDLRALVYMYNYINDFRTNNVLFDRNFMKHGSYGFYLYNYNYSNEYSDNLIISNNTLEDQYYMGIHLMYHRRATIINNKIYDNTPRFSSAYGIYLRYLIEGLNLSGNIIYNKQNQALNAYSVTGAVGDTSIIANNFFQTPNNSSSYAVYLESVPYMYFTNNNLYANQSNTGSAVAYLYSLSSNNYVYNNNFYNAGAGRAIIYYYTMPAQMDNNNYFSASSTAPWQRTGTNYSTLSAWQSATSRDANALNVDPEYISSTDLHIRNVDLNEAGKLLNYVVPMDIDGEMRDSLTPDIGADEFIIESANDAGISGSVTPVQPFASGSNSVKVVLQNFGSDTLKTVSINWAVNGVLQSAYSWSGTLRLGQRDTVDLGNFNFTANTRFDLDFWTSQPNSVTDTVTYNDSFAVRDLYPALSGNYTVGGLLPDFANLNEAISRLKRSGIVGNVNFNIRAGIYNEPLLIEPYPGAQSGRMVTFQPENNDSSSVTIRYSGSSPHGSQMVYLKGVDYVRFNKLTFDLSNYSYSYTIARLDNGSANVSFTNCNFKMSSYYYYGYYSQYGIYSSGDRDDSLKVSSCSFDRGRTAIYAYGVSSAFENGHMIENSRFKDQWNSAIVIYYGSGAVLKGNFIESEYMNGYPMLYLYSTNGNVQVSYNKMAVTNNGNSGIYWYGHNGASAQRAMLFNNFISVYSSSSSNYGLYVSNSNYVDFYFNTIHLYGGSSTSSKALYFEQANTVDSRNNILSNNSAGYVIYMNNSGLSQSNYNDLYSSGSVFGYVTGSSYNTIGAWRSAMSRDNNSVSVNPVFNSNTDLHTGMVNLDSAGTPIASVTDDIDGESRNSTHPDIGADEFTSLPYNMGLSSILYPTDVCNEDSVQVKVNVYNYGNLKHSNFPIRYTLNGGSTVVTETFTDSILPGQSKMFEFAAKEKLTLNTPYQLVVWTDLSGEQFRANDTLKQTVTNFSVPDSIVSMVPSDSAQNMSYPFTLSWLPANGATLYDVYIWPDTSAKPSTPAFSNTTAISVQVSSGLIYGQRYKWQVHAKNAHCETPGRTQHFQMKFLPDIILEEVKGPSSAFSGNTVSVSWKVKNTGQGQASGGWWDQVYLSDNTVYDGTDVYLGGVQNPSGLNPNQNYSQSMNVTLPNGISGKYHFIIRSDVYNQLLESDNNNNTGADTAGSNITLTPPPDLIVSSIVRPATGFSGNNVTLQYTVKNDGTGATRSGFWYDRIYLSKDTVLDGTDYNLKTLNRTANLQADSTYTRSETVKLPDFISGGYYFFVKTDINNNEYEHGSENNNSRISDSINVILTPPADLIVTDLVAPSIVSNREQVNVSYYTINDGGSSTSGYFYDRIYISTNSVFNSNAIALVDVYQGTLQAGDTHVVSRSVNIPNNISGQAYWYVFTDYVNYINEVSNEGNNIASAATTVKSPDLRVRNVVVPTQDTTGHSFTISYDVLNNGPGKSRNDTRTDSVYISLLDTFNRAHCTPVAVFRYTPSSSLDSGAVMARTGNVTIPDGFDGDRYFYVFTDASNDVFENLLDNNNIGGSNKMKVILAPYPDLVPYWTSYPDSTAAGESLVLGLDIDNLGDTTARPNWRDRIYLSKDTIFNPARVIELTNLIRGGEVLKNGTYSLNPSVVLPAALSLGDYYFYCFTDADQNVYEHNDEGNNIVRSGKVFIDGYPPVDLQVSCPNHVDTMYSGTNYPFTFTVTNIGQAQTGQNAWGDAIYLSTDTILSSGDTRLNLINRTGTLAKNASYNVNSQVSIPNGLFGTYYLLAVADDQDLNNDEDSSNNYRAKCAPGAVPVTILLTPSSDLQITAWEIPGSGTTGQPLKVKWTVSNKGTGPTRHGSWSDRFYLSTNGTLEGSDPLIGVRNRSGNLDTNQSYTDSIELSISSAYSGNYYLFIQTDGANLEYEHMAENNNAIASVVTFSPAPPADLTVVSISAPDSVISGDLVSISWSVRNTGSNPASGWMTDNLYLSKDDKVDAGDKLIGSEHYHISLAPSGVVNRNKNVTISGVELGDYYLLVSTDVLNNIAESNDTNNVGVSTDPVNVNVPELVLGVLKLDTLLNNQSRYYRLVIPANIEGESVLLTLKGDSVNGDNQLFVRREALASGSQFDYKFRDPFQGNQEIIIPEVFEGTYYIYLTGKTSVGSSQPVKLLAEILPFAIRRVTPNKGGNGGEVTLKIEGSKFDENTTFSIPLIPDTVSAFMDEEGLYSAPQQMAVKMELFDPTIAYATFSLIGVPEGIYNVNGQKLNEEASAEDAFTVEASTGELLEVNVINPGSTRTDAVIALTVNYSNNGNNDIVNRKIEIVSTQGAPIGLTSEDLSKKETRISITLEDNEGPPGRLRAGSSGSIKVYIKASNALGVIVNK